MPFPIYDTEDAVPADQKDVYEAKDGKWHPKVPDVANLNSALDKERTRAATEEAARKKAEADLAAERRRKEAEKNGITEEQLQKLREEDALKRKPIEEENAAIKTKLEKITHADKVRDLALKAGVMPDRIEDAMLILVDGPRPRTKLTGESIVVLNKDGGDTTETLDRFLAEGFKAEKPWLYQGTGASGSGAPGSNGGGGGGGGGAPQSKEALDEKRRQVAGAL